MAEELINAKELLMKLELSVENYMQIFESFNQFLREHGLEEEFRRFSEENAQKKREAEVKTLDGSYTPAADEYVPIMIMRDTLHRTNDEYGNIEWVARFYRTDEASVDGEVEQFDAHYNPGMDSVYMTARGTATAGDIDPMYLTREETVEVKRQMGWAAVTFGITTLQGSDKLPAFYRRQESLDVPLAVFQYTRIMEMFGREMNRSILDYADRIISRVYRNPENHAIEELRADITGLIESSGKGADDPDVMTARDFIETAQKVHDEVREERHGEIRMDPAIEEALAKEKEEEQKEKKEKKKGLSL